MMDHQVITFIGGGNMASALLKGLLDAGKSADTMRICEPDARKRGQLAEQFHSIVSGRALGLVEESHVVVLAVKPEVVAPVLAEIGTLLGRDTLVISIAAGLTTATLKKGLPEGQPLVRVMPNTPALIGAGISVLFAARGVSEEKLSLARQVMEAVGEVEVVTDESLMDGVTALSGSGPAYVYLIAEALSDGGVACGLPRPLADRLAVKTLIGAARLIDETGEHPGVLKNQVTSPGGTTIAAVAQLERSGVRSGLIDAVTVAWERSRALNKG